MDDSIIITNKNEGKSYKFDRKIESFSYFFENQNEENEFCIPETLKIKGQTLEIIGKFLQLHNYDIKKATSSQILFENYKDSMSSQSLKFLQECIEPLPNQEIQQLLRTVGFFQIEAIERIVYTYLANKYHISLTVKKSQKKLKFYGVDNVDPQTIQNLKMKYMDYFRGVGQRFLMDYYKEQQSQ